MKKVIILLVVLLLLAMTMQVALAEPKPVPAACNMNWWWPGDGPGNHFGVDDEDRGMYHVHMTLPHGQSHGGDNMMLLCPG